MIQLPMKQLTNRKWVYPLDAFGLQHDTKEFDTEEAARNAHRLYMAGKLAAKNSPAPSLMMQAQILKARWDGHNI